MITAQERETYTDVWATVPDYGLLSPGERLADRFLEMSGATSGTVLDAGCGNGKGALALADRGFDVTMCDLTPEGLLTEAIRLPFVNAVLWQDLFPVAYVAAHGQAQFDYVYCCDVLEHIPTEFTMLVIARLLSVARRGVFLSICTMPDHFGVWVGKPLHQTVREFVWWRDRLAELGRVVEARDVLNAGLFYVEPRC